MPHIHTETLFKDKQTIFDRFKLSITFNVCTCKKTYAGYKENKEQTTQQQILHKFQMNFSHACIHCVVVYTMMNKQSSSNIECVIIAGHVVPNDDDAN